MNGEDYGTMTNLRHRYLEIAHDIIPWAVYSDGGVTMFHDQMKGRMRVVSRLLVTLDTNIERSNSSELSLAEEGRRILIHFFGE